jgi:predicted Zn-dependent peptidase
MRARVLLIVILPLVLWACASPSVQADPADPAPPAGLTQPDPRRMQFEPVQFTPPEPERVVLENGMIVYLLEDHELPLVTMTATVRTGGWLDPPDKVGLAAIAGATMRTGGTRRMSAAEVDEELEQLAAGIAVGIGTESGGATLDVLKKDLPRGLRIFADILMTPAFDPSRLELAKLQTIEGIRRRQDLPQSIAGREFSKLLYGPSHPFARESTVESVSRITQDDVTAFHARSIHPNAIILGVTGDFEKGALLASLRETFGGWPKGEPQPILPSTVQIGDGAGAGDGSAAAGANGRFKAVRYVGKGTSQTHLRAGHLSIKEDDPDYPALVILNDILGGGAFRSRLFQDVRTKQGLAYSVGSSVHAGTREWGAFVFRAETKSASTREVITRMLANMERLREQPVTDAELAEAKEAFVNSFVFSFTSPSAIVGRLIGLEYDGLPKDFLQELREKVVKLTPDDLLRAARKHLHPDRLKLLAVGSPDALPGQLSTFGAVKEIKLEN